MEILTEELILKPAKNSRDNQPFIEMLRRESGDFRIFCGVDYSEENLLGFTDYFEGEKDFLYAVFLKSEPDTFIGYMGLTEQRRYEAEFYISRAYRKRGYASQALRAICDKAFAGELCNQQGLKFEEDIIYATTQEMNIATINTLKSVGFERNKEIPWMEQLFIMSDDTIVDNDVEEYCLRKGK